MAKKILVIDDDPINIKLVQSQLKLKDFETIVAVNGAEGLEKVKTCAPDLIILDVEMPEMDGYSFMLEKNKIAETVHIPVIVLTSHEEMQPIFELKGVKEYCTKPLNIDDLFEKINKVLSPS